MCSHQKLILIGGGGHCKSVIDVAESAGYAIIGILERPDYHADNIMGYKIVGNDDDIDRYVEDAGFVITVGQIKDARLRIKLSEQVVNAGGKFATPIASTAYVSNHAKIGEGTVIMHQATVNADANIGKNCIINTHCNIEHDVKIGDFCHVSTGAMVNGNCVIGNRVFIGSGAVIANGISICDDCVIGAGAVVTRSIECVGTYIGNPAKIKQ